MKKKDLGKLYDRLTPEERPLYGQEVGPCTLQLVRETGTRDIPKTAALKA